MKKVIQLFYNNDFFIFKILFNFKNYFVELSSYFIIFFILFLFYFYLIFIIKYFS